jgi:hypothetical protein
VFSPGCQIDGKARHEWMDAEVEFETGDSGTLHDVITPYHYQGQETDPAEEAARNLDWESFLASHSERHRTAILVLVEGGTMREAGKRCGLKDSAALVLKRRIVADLIEFFGEDAIRRLLDGIRPDWESDLRMSRERHLCQVSGRSEKTENVSEIDRLPRSSAHGVPGDGSQFQLPDIEAHLSTQLATAFPSQGKIGARHNRHPYSDRHSSNGGVGLPVCVGHENDHHRKRKTPFSRGEWGLPRKLKSICAAVPMSGRSYGPNVASSYA